MSQSSQSSYVTSSHQASHAVMSTTKKRVHDEMVEQNQKQIAHRKSIDTFGRRTSQYRGVTRHRWTSRYEAHLCSNWSF
ncbi:hypothetical protein S245_030043 [Arachis hypogaea]